MLIVHGPNSNVDLINELAQQKRLDASSCALSSRRERVCGVADRHEVTGSYEIDQALLGAEHAAGKRAAAVRLAYAMHSFPAQGATLQGTATLADHWLQAKRETYVARLDGPGCRSRGRRRAP
jgi:hypothetical protein